MALKRLLLFLFLMITIFSFTSVVYGGTPTRIGNIFIEHDEESMSWNHDEATPEVFIVSDYYNVEDAIPTS